MLACVAGAVFALAEAHPFAPGAAPASGTVAPGDVYRGETVFQRSCASCHGDQGAGGGIGPRLAASGLGAVAIQTRVRTGAGAMPAGLVSGRDESDVVAYVASLAGG